MKRLQNFDCIYLLKNNYIGNLTFIGKNRPYVLPITYYYDEEENCIISYSGEGHKIKAMRANKSVALGLPKYQTLKIGNL